MRLLIILLFTTWFFLYANHCPCEKPPDDCFRCVKVPIKHILKHIDINSSKISDAVVMANKIVIHTLQFMKLYLVYYYDTNKSLPTIDKQFINSCLKTVCDKKETGRPPKAEVKKIK